MFIQLGGYSLIDYTSFSTDKRMSGILLHPTSFPSPYGIGDLGKEAYAFIDFLAKSKQTLWQVLPLGPTGYGDSPYQSFSSFAGQPLLISPDILMEDGLLIKSEWHIPEHNPHKIDYGFVIQHKFSLLQKAFDQLKQNITHPYYEAWQNFCHKEASWLDDYALFMACKDYFDGKEWLKWTEDIAKPSKAQKEHWRIKLSSRTAFYTFIQFLFFKQWHHLREYAHQQGILIIGDLPIFTSYDSSDVWAKKELFLLDDHGYPTEVAGVPPDYFSKTGQLWGNPLYDWPSHKKQDYAWWVSRLAHTLKLVDIVRIDHFRGFESFWAIPYGEETAIYGTWKKGPGADLMNTFTHKLGEHLPIIAEDLGVITDEVCQLRDAYHLPGMKILQFAFENLKDNDFLPHHYIKNTICYSGTHDNDTTIGWYAKADEAKKIKVRQYMQSDAMDISWAFIRTCYSSISKMAIVPMQDVLSLGSQARMNIPGTAMGNWQWRYTKEMLTDSISQRLAYITDLYGRSST
ncbi:4-alpha-glucanotransferase [Vallitalea pronyensis]|uniref:4-alpha-glucanotransferase n=1 Tax=Vallitalea pronyensis TaxID=1348613 RepID=A0A8J8SF96_9FIRM|nr:4-alpha-glucanotransferase [Vallitalea pronyensis]